MLKGCFALLLSLRFTCRWRSRGDVPVAGLHLQQHRPWCQVHCAACKQLMGGASKGAKYML